MSQIRFGRQRVVCCLLLLPACIALLAPTAAPASQQEALEQLQRGIDELEKGNPEKGLAEIRKVIEANPTLATAHFYAGVASAQMSQWQQAYDYFVAAAEHGPGYGEAHMQACRVAYNLQDFDASWEHAILAAQAGIDMSGAFAGLEAVKEGPENWRQRLEVPRVLIGNIDTDRLLQTEAALPGGNAATGPRLSTEMLAEIHDVRRRFGEEFVRSAAFGVVSNVELATYILQLEVDEVGDTVPHTLRGFVKLLDADTQDEVYSRPLRLSNIGSVSSLRNDIGRYLGYIEEWLRERQPPPSGSPITR